MWIVELFFMALGFLALALFLTPSYATDKPAGLPCAPQVYRLLTEWKIKSWEESSPAEQKPLRAITENKERVEVEYDGRSSKLSLISPIGISEVSLVAPECKRSMRYTPGSPRFRGKVFGESDLKALLEKSEKSKSKAILVFWSPGMPLSLRARKELEEMKAQFQAELVPLADPNSPQLDFNDRTFSVGAFFERGVMNHFPSYLFIKNGKILGPTQFGWKEKPRMLSLIEREFRK